MGNSGSAGTSACIHVVRGTSLIGSPLGLYLESSDELFIESRKVIQITMSILDQKNGKYFTKTTDLLVCTHPEGWGWYNCLPLKELQDMSRGYIIESKCVLKADFTIFGSSNDG